MNDPVAAPNNSITPTPQSDDNTQTAEVPEAQLVFDIVVASVWLHNAGARKSKVYQSVRFEPEGMPAKQLTFLLSLAAGSIIGKVITRKQAVLGPGILYVPMSLAKSPVLENLVRGKRIGKYVAFQRP